MIFLDTNVWFELLANCSPKQPHSIQQAQLASSFIKNNKEEIVTCKEQLVEMIRAIAKRKRREYSDAQKAAGNSGVGSVKEFRKKEEFSRVITLCKSVCEDVETMAKVDNGFSYSVNDILEKFGMMDANDIMYFDYCKQNSIKLITFDKELADVDKSGEIVTLLGA